MKGSFVFFQLLASPNTFTYPPSKSTYFGKEFAIS